MKRRILFDLGHPGHFHLFKNTIEYFKGNPDYQVFITTRNIPIIRALLEASNFAYCIIGSKRNGFFGKMFSVLETDFQMLLFVLKNKIELEFIVVLFCPMFLFLQKCAVGFLMMMMMMLSL